MLVEFSAYRPYNGMKRITMSFDIVLHITEDSQRGRVIQQIADEQHVTPEQVIEQIIDDGFQAQQSRYRERGRYLTLTIFALRAQVARFRCLLKLAVLGLRPQTQD